MQHCVLHVRVKYEFSYYIDSVLKVQLGGEGIQGEAEDFMKHIMYNFKVYKVHGLLPPC